MIERLAYAKINLFLDIKGMREDGYHDIVSVMQTVDWADKITLDKTDSTGIHVTCSDPSIPIDQRNTAYKAADLFFSRLQKNEMGVRIHIEKHIPWTAGMAGGSADAAATLWGLNDLFGSPFSSTELLKIGQCVGADVPFCLVGGTKKLGGIGERIESFPSMPPCYLVCAKQGEGVSTPIAYGALDEQYNNFPYDAVRYYRLNRLQQAFGHGSLLGLPDGLYNIFEEPIERMRPSVSLLKRTLLDTGAIAAMMSGSGPSVFGVFEDLETASAALEVFRRLDAVCEICRPITPGGSL